MKKYILTTIIIIFSFVNAESEILYHETFENESSQENLSSNYPDLTYINGVAFVVDGALNLSRGGVYDAYYSQVKLPKFNATNVTITVELGFHSFSIAYNAGIKIGENNIIFHPYYNGQFRVDGPGGFNNVNVGFTPKVNIVYKMIVTIHDTGIFNIKLVNGVDPNVVFETSFTNPQSVGADISLLRYGSDNTGTGFFESILVEDGKTQASVPVSDAGDDQTIMEIGTLVQLDGSESYDLEGDSIEYSWAILSKPENSNATLSDPQSSSPTFEADVHGDYVLELIVNDDGSVSDPDQVVVSFGNVSPVANSGKNFSVFQGETVCFDGSNSTDANLDPLSYSWAVFQRPVDSSAYLDAPGSIKPCITLDVAGNYVINLTVNDGLVDSAPSRVSVLAVAYSDAVTETLLELVTAVNNIDLGAFKNPNMQNALTSKINAALDLVGQGGYDEALSKLQNDILGKTNGCAENSEPDKNDWLDQNCESQDQIYPLIDEAIEYLLKI